MLMQSLLGLLLQEHYRDVGWIRATWFGNDCVTLVVAAPLLWLANAARSRESVRGAVVSGGVIGYAVYNYAFYLFGAALNVFFPLYVASFALGVIGLATAVVNAPRARAGRMARWVGAYLTVVGAVLGAVWLTLWARFAFAGVPTPIEPEAFKIVAAVDLVTIVPALAAGGVLLWRHRPHAMFFGTSAAIAGALYLAVLTVSSILSVRQGLVVAPGELPLWLPLAILTTSAALVLLHEIGPSVGGASRHDRP
jgi:hypothetical protein